MVTSGHIGWAVVGCGWVARDYVAPAIWASCNGDLAVLCDPDPAALDAVKTDPSVRRTGELAAVLADPAVDAVYVAAPNHLHAPLAVRCAQAGKHVLCEKPMATTLVDARAMIDAAHRAGILYATAFDQRYHAAHRSLRALVEEGALGRVTQARVHYACWLGPDWATDNWRVDAARSGGGALIDLAPHAVDLLDWLVGDGGLAELCVMTQRRVHPYAVDDGAVLASRFEGGALATIHVAYSCPETFPRRRLELIGTRAMALADDTMGQTSGGALTLLDAETGARRAIEFDDGRSPFLNQVEAFADAALTGRPLPFSPERDLRLFALLLDAAREPITQAPAAQETVHERA